MSNKQEHQAFIEKKGKFIVDCSHAVFSTEEIELLEKYGHWFKALETGELKPFTDRQKAFILVATHKQVAFSLEEVAWLRYQWRKDWEADHDNISKEQRYLEEDTFHYRSMVKQVRSTMGKVMRDNHKNI